ncbi:ABC transporter substrate-binding protein [Methylomagnum sp.]
MKRSTTLILPVILWLSSLANAAAPANPEIRIGTLAFGTLNWELAVIRDQGLDKAHGVSLSPVTLAGAEAGKIALQGNSVDMVVGDWIWVAQQRGQGMDFTFSPYSTSHGALMVPADSPIHGLADLKGKRLGIVGGGLDKNWLLLRALAEKTQGLNLDQAVEKTFGAPPLLNQALLGGKLDAVLNYWNYAAKLEAQGYRRVLDGRAILRGLGIETDVPALGYIFREGWAKTHGEALSGFFAAANEAKRAICESDATWQKVAPLTQESDEKVRATLRRDYCAGRVTGFGEAGRKAAETIFSLINSIQAGRAGTKPAGFPDGVFWSTTPLN